MLKLLNMVNDYFHFKSSCKIHELNKSTLRKCVHSEAENLLPRQYYPPFPGAIARSRYPPSSVVSLLAAQPQQYINWCLINASFPGGKKQPSTLTPSTSFYKHPVKCSSWDLGSAARLVESTVHRGLALRLTTHTFD